MLAVYSDAPWKLLVWALAPFQSHATLGAIWRAGKFYHGPWYLGICVCVRAQAAVFALSHSSFSASSWNVTHTSSPTQTFWLISRGNSQRDIVCVIVACSCVGTLRSKYLSKIRAIDCLRTELSPTHLWLDWGPPVMSRSFGFRGCCFVPFPLQENRFSCGVSADFHTWAGCRLRTASCWTKEAIFIQPVGWTSLTSSTPTV